MTGKLIEDFLRPFSLEQVSQMHSLAMHMRKFGVSADEVVEMCALRVRQSVAPVHAGGGRRQPARISCPECGASLVVSRVNVSRCTAVGGEWKASVVCGGCHFSALSKRTVSEVIESGAI